MNTRAALWLGLGASLLLLGYTKRAAIAQGVTDFMTPRGIRNNNPGNIRRSGTQWQGMAAQQTDASFVQFISPEYGIRAISKILDSYANKYGLNTVRAIISRWAPPNENDTEAYIQAVADAVGVDPDVPINVAAAKPQIVAAIINQENGQQPYNLAQLNNGVAMA